MTSKISCARLILEDIRKRSWLTALTSVIFFLIIPVNTMLYLSSRSEELVRSSTRSSIAESLPGLAKRRQWLSLHNPCSAPDSFRDDRF